ncbi:alpha/beta fold hydrolase [Sneathiella sp. P13V-1]|uniref:alpha/beta hydrolase n=1 Tax=Sneathiella sp. P13V-1 TaxID=2697366 RepID=UPI00187B60FB|nr:alpha/beta hydrolase [Sneathiella sp. P13V-1]MBE7635275.1 alpha/beta fold hydrolase [Sneathiella sp. P13V-1]
MFGMWFLKLTFILIALYAGIVGTAYFLQTWLIFPSGLAGGSSNLPAGASYSELTTEDGENVVVVRIKPSRPSAEPRPLLFGFGGNAWNADIMAILLHQIFPEHEIAALHYRGYGPSSGRPSAMALFEDARLAHDYLIEEHADGVVAIGFSLGSSVAVDLAGSRSLQGIVLVTPFDSLKELAATHYPWLPVRLLLRHRMETADSLRRLNLPVAVITADNDKVIPAARSSPVREAARDLRADFTIKNVGHNDIYTALDFTTALIDSVKSVSDD